MRKVGIKQLAQVFVCVLCLFTSSRLLAQSLTHPHIWVKDSQKNEILNKINTYTWASDLFNQYKSRVDPKKNAHKTNPETILKTIPGFPGDQTKHREALTLGYEAALLYWLTGQEDYGQLAADILAHYCKDISAISGTVHFTTGASYSHLIDTREGYTKPPMIYDFAYAFLKKAGTKVYDLDTKTRVSFNFTKAENTFIKLADGVFNEGSINSNHPILEAPGALFNLLSIEDDAKRNTYFNKFMNGTPKQNGLTWMMDECKASSVWPEATGYSIGPHRIILELMNVVDMYKPELNVIGANKDLIKNAFFFENYKFPNDQNVMRFGDAHRDRLNTTDLMERVLVMSDRKNYGSLKNDAFEMLKALYKADGGYKPKVATQSLEWNNPYYLLWGTDLPSTNVTPVNYNTSINIDYAGIAMQRNINTTNRVESGLMGYIGGAHYVHSHLTGIDMELYGLGAVLGTGGGDLGAADREEDVFRNYHRIYAGHNTVIVNGTSKGDGKGAWKADNQLMQSTVKTIGAEPSSLVDPISSEFSFSAQMLDDKINDAKQQRVLSVIRTSDNTGYYFDLFRSKSNSTNHFHDYVYHNVGDGVNLVDDKNTTLPLTAQTNRYTSTSSAYGGKTVEFPGWHFFEQVKTSAKTTSAVKATIPMTKQGTRYIHLLMPAGENREYTSCKGPETIEAQVGYEGVKTPIVTVRHYGEAWNKPFITIFEPSRQQSGSVKSVENLYSGNKIVGARVNSVVNGKTITDYVISNENASDVYTSTTPAISFTGRFAIIRVTETETTLYIGEGTSLTYEGKSLTADPDKRGLKVVSNQTQVNQDPIVTITSPSNNATYELGQDITLSANASDVDGAVTKINFKVNNSFYKQDATAPFEVVFSPIQAGTYTIGARAFDDKGGETEETITINVVAPNVPPVVYITSPLDESIYTVGEKITLSAYATDSDGTVTKVNFKVNNVFYKQVTTAPYEVTFTPTAAGTYIIGARTFDDKDGESEVAVAILVEVVTGSSDPMHSKEVFVYPNPSRSGVFNISLPKIYEVYNASGDIISKGYSENIDLSQQADGLYFLRLEEDVIKLIK